MRNKVLPLFVSLTLSAPAAAVVAEVVSAPAPAGALSNSAAWTNTASGWNRSSSPTIADVNGDSTDDIVVGNQDGWLRVLDGATGGNLSGWPQKAKIGADSYGTAIDSTPAVGDLWNDGGKEIVVGVGALLVPNQNGGVVIFDSNGHEHCSYMTRTDGATPGYGAPVFSSPAIGKIDGDAYADIVFGAFDGHIYGIDHNCNKILDDDIEDSEWSSPALYDIDGDGRDEVFIGGDQTAGGNIDWSGGEFRAIKWTPGYPGNARELWKRQVNDTVWSSPAIGDIDGDGRVEAVVGDGFYYGRSDKNRVFAFHLDNGSTVAGWPVTMTGQTMSAPALGDLTGDGVPEVVEASGDGWVRAYRGNGAAYWSRQLQWNGAANSSSASSPIIADFNGDGHNDVGSGNAWGYFTLNGTNGAILNQVNTWLSHENAAAVGNFGGAGWKLIVDGFVTANHTHTLQAYNMPAPGVTPPFPMFRHDAEHRAGPVGINLLEPGFCRHESVPTRHPDSGSSNGYWQVSANGTVYSLMGAPSYGNASLTPGSTAVAISATHSGAGYYILDSKGGITTRGDAQSFGSAAGWRLNAPIIALAPTPSGLGYWLLGRDGGIFGFGDAHYHGSTGNWRLNAPIISMAATASGQGYWLLGADGGIFGFGDAHYHGSTGNWRLNAPVISMAATASGQGYWLLGGDGGIFGFGDAHFYGSVPGMGYCISPRGVQIRPTLTGAGYFILVSDGRVLPFGDAQTGSNPTLNGLNPARDLTIRS